MLAQGDEGETPDPTYFMGMVHWGDSGQGQGCMNDLLNVCFKTFVVSADVDDRCHSGQGLAP